MTAATHPLRTRPRVVGARAEEPARRSLPIELAAFTALAAYGAGHWTRLVVDPPVGRFALCVAIAVAGGAALALLGRAPLDRAVRLPLLVGTAVLTLAVALVAMGLPARLFFPGGWAELTDGLDRGLTGVQAVSWPYGGTEEWVRLVILLGVPLQLAVAACLAFWPAGRAAPLMRGVGLAVLLLLYGTAVTQHEPSGPVLRGLVLFLLVGAYLWLPRMSPREAGVAGAVVVSIGVLTLPFAAKLDANEPWWNYRDFNWFGQGRSVTFQWDHTYGPLDWPREGTTLMNVKSSSSHYWKAETLDRFDGYAWLRSGDNSRTAATADLPTERTPPGQPWHYGELNPRWIDTAEVTMRALRSTFVVGVGTTYRVQGVDSVSGSSDGTTVTLEDPIKRGDSYTVTGYDPEPSARILEGAPRSYGPGLLLYTSLSLPTRGGADSTSESGPLVTVDPWGSTPVVPSDAPTRLLESPYARTYRLSRRLTAGAAAPYDAVRRIQGYLRRNLLYAERVPARPLPLDAFLFRDKKGYCQQFSGAMALMLRMVGIPARVAAGFSPGSFNRDTGEYRVRDLDAHSWVEVYFNEIGWVTFDPTPAASPAELQVSDISPGSAARLSTDSAPGQRGDRPEQKAPGASTAQPSDKGLSWWLALAGLATLAALGAVSLAVLRRRRRPPPSADAQVRELRAALQRLGWRVPASTTLLGLEQRLARTVGPRSAAYAARLRVHRYSPNGPGVPRREERRALRRELMRTGGFATRLRALIALPPRGPRPG